MFFTAIEEWELSDEQGQQLLDVTEEHYLEYMSDTSNTFTDEIMTRLACISQIYASLRNIYSSENRILWLRK